MMRLNEIFSSLTATAHLSTTTLSLNQVNRLLKTRLVTNTLRHTRELQIIEDGRSRLRAWTAAFISQFVSQLISFAMTWTNKCNPSITQYPRYYLLFPHCMPTHCRNLCAHYKQQWAQINMNATEFFGLWNQNINVSLLHVGMPDSYKILCAHCGQRWA
jgi:hypothetical protein